ncbi:MAG: DUF4340 domain-containing protein [Gammaproteobacteria bacterium]
MSQRNVLILLAAVVVLVTLMLVGQRSGGNGGGGKLFAPSLEAALNDVERVTITKANNEIVVALERKPEGWVAANKNGYPADVSKLRQGLSALAEAKILEQKTANPELYSHLGVEDVSGEKAAGIAVALTAKGKDLSALILGDADGTKHRYVRRVGDAQSYLIDRNPEFARGVGQWLDAQIVDVRSDRIAQVTITPPDGPVVRLSKPNTEAATYDVADVPKGRELLYPGVANVIGNSLRELNLEDVEPAAASAPTKPTVVEFHTFDGLVVRAEGEKRGDASWVSFTASVDSAQAARATAAATATPPAQGAGAPAGPPRSAAPPPAAPDPAADAARINAKVGPWRYKIATFQYDQMTRRLADLLKPPPEPATKRDPQTR